MRIFLDTNVWASAFGTRGICRDLVAWLLSPPKRRDVGLLTCEQVKAETLRALQLKFRVSAEGLAAATTVLGGIESVTSFSCPPLPPDFPDADDWPILCAAAESHADCFVTGDKALLALGQIGNLPMVTPRDAYQRLRGFV